MSTDRAEKVLVEAIGKYVAENPTQKAELQEALEAILARTNHVATAVLDCNKAIVECMEMMGTCPMLATSRIS